jgi:hypothetical protein
MDDVIKARKKALAELESGEENKATSLTDAIDDWIEVIKANTNKKKERKERKGRQDRETAESLS